MFACGPACVAEVVRVLGEKRRIMGERNFWRVVGGRGFPGRDWDYGRDGAVESSFEGGYQASSRSEEGSKESDYYGLEDKAREEERTAARGLAESEVEVVDRAQKEAEGTGRTQGVATGAAPRTLTVAEEAAIAQAAARAQAEVEEAVARTKGYIFCEGFDARRYPSLGYFGGSRLAITGGSSRR